MPTDTEILIEEIRRKEKEREDQLRVLENDPKRWNPPATMSNGYAEIKAEREAEKRAAAEAGDDQ